MGSGQAGRAGMDRTAGRPLYWSALIATVLGALYLAGLLGRLIVNGSVHAVSGGGVQVISAIVAIAWDVILVVLFAALRRQPGTERPLAADLALTFVVLMCALSSISWFVQLAVLPRLAADDAARALLDPHNELSITYAMEHLGWGLFFGLGALCAAAAFSTGRLGTWLKWVLIGSGVLSLLHFLGVILPNQLLGDLGYIAWGVLLPVATALLAARWRKGS